MKVRVTWHWRCGRCGALRFFPDKVSASWAASRHTEKCVSHPNVINRDMLNAPGRKALEILEGRRRGTRTQ